MKIFFVILAMGLCACAGNAPPPTPEPAKAPSPTPRPAPTNTIAPSPTAITPDSYAGAILTLTRKGGFVGANEGWTIYPDDKIVTRQNVEMRADPAKTAALFAAIEKVKFFTLPDYGHAEPLMCADCFEITLRVTTPAKTYAITTYEVTNGVPEEYKKMQAMALDLVKTASVFK